MDANQHASISLKTSQMSIQAPKQTSGEKLSLSTWLQGSSFQLRLMVIVNNILPSVATTSVPCMTTQADAQNQT